MTAVRSHDTHRHVYFRKSLFYSIQSYLESLIDFFFFFLVLPILLVRFGFTGGAVGSVVDETGSCIPV